MSNFNCDNPSDYITLNEPAAVFWDGRSCKDSRKQVAKPGAYYCGYRNCNNTVFDGWNNTLDGMWVPPNQYVALWDANKPDRAVRGAEIPPNKLYDASQSWTQGPDANTVKNLCPKGGYVYNITYAGYGVPNSDKTEIIEGHKDLRSHWGIRNMLGAKEFRFESADSVFGDPVRGKTKTVVTKYECTENDNAEAIFIPEADGPSGVYGPGFYDNFNQTGMYDNTIRDDYGKKGSRIGVNVNDTIVIRRSRPWKDHLRNCCFQKGSSPLDKELCGKFDGKTSAGRKECKSFLSECNADDIKFGGKCYSLCMDNPAECDDIKTLFCKEHPADPFCDCINYQTRPAYKFQEARNPEVKSYPRSCMEPACRLEDQKQVFITDPIKQEAKDAAACANLNLAKTEISGSHNIIEAGGITQKITSSQVIDRTGRPQETTGVNKTTIDTTSQGSATQTNEMSDTVKIILIIIGAILGVGLLSGIVFALYKGFSKTKISDNPQYNMPPNMQPLNTPLNMQPLNMQPLNMQPLNTQPLNMQPLNMQPLNMQPLNTPPNMQPLNTPPNMQPLNTPLNMQPLNTPPNMQPLNTPPNMQPLNTPLNTPPNMQPLNMQPLNMQPY
jgi:hypothetical protein